MAEAQPRDWTLGEFLAWEEQQAERYEFVGGQIVMMAGGTQAHALIATNLIALLRPGLRGSPCRPNGSDLRIPTPGTGNSRYPDVTIDCGKFNAAAHDASEPVVVFEVLSKSTGWYDQTQKLRDYASVATIRQYVCISQSECRVSVWLRDVEGRLVQQGDLVELDAELAIVRLQQPLRVADIYEETGLANRSSL
jgi:Uma2 family endonuclease